MSKVAENQTEFWLRVKMELLRRDLSVAQLARRLRRPRPTVSSAIHGASFPKVRELVRKELSL
jgi:hypothetical protein